MIIIIQVKFSLPFLPGTQINYLGLHDKENKRSPETPGMKPPSGPKLLFSTLAVDSHSFFRYTSLRPPANPIVQKKKKPNPTHIIAYPGSPEHRCEGRCLGRLVSMLAMNHTNRLLRVSSGNEFVLVERIDSRLQHPNTAAMPGWEKKI